MYEEIYDTAVSAARAGARALAPFAAGDEALDVRLKGEHDYVTEADEASEAAILGEIARRFPDHRVLAEESGYESGGSEYQWLVDPLDGTTNFLQGLPVYCISVACRRGDEVVAGVVLDPVGDNLFAARRGGGATWNGRPMRVSERSGLAGSFLATGYPWRARGALERYLEIFSEVFMEARSIRRCGAAALDMAYTAAGVYDGFFEFRLSPWDIAAGILLVREAGGTVTDLDGGEGYFAGGNVVCGSPAVQAELLRAVGRHASEAEVDRLSPRGAAAGEPATVGAPEAP